MENVAHVVATVKMQQKQSVPAVQFLCNAAHTRWQFKSHMEFGADFQKMIA
jgi:hypothetical protein